MTVVCVVVLAVLVLACLFAFGLSQAAGKPAPMPTLADRLRAVREEER